LTLNAILSLPVASTAPTSSLHLPPIKDCTAWDIMKAYANDTIDSMTEAEEHLKQYLCFLQLMFLAVQLKFQLIVFPVPDFLVCV
jgi:hypothetical protein